MHCERSDSAFSPPEGTSLQRIFTGTSPRKHAHLQTHASISNPSKSSPSESAGVKHDGDLLRRVGESAQHLYELEPPTESSSLLLAEEAFRERTVSGKRVNCVPTDAYHKRKACHGGARRKQ